MNDHGYAKININVAMRLQVLPQNIALLWQLINHKHIVSIPELLRCHTIIMAGFIFWGDYERFAHFHAKNLIEIC